METSRIVIGRFSEIALKGRNRGWFMRRLIQNLQSAVADCGPVQVVQSASRILISGGDAEEVLARALQVPGLHSASIAHDADFSFDAIVRAARTAIARELERTSQGPGTVTFKVETRRAAKGFPLSSYEVSSAVGAALLESFPALRVDVHAPEIVLGIDIRGEHNFVFAGIHPGLGGLPVGTSGKAICLLSGGIDSPVAAFQCMRRGVEVHCVSFHSHPFLGESSREKIRDLVRVLTRYQRRMRFYSLPFAEIQKRIRDLAPESYRTVLYRRMMQRLASRVARHERALALVSGENIGQVASQTLTNMGVIGAAAELNVLRPLLGFDKQEIIAWARRIGTYEISIRAEPDCCTIFQPRKPIIEARLELCLEVEERMDMEDLMKVAWEEKLIETYPES